MNKIFNIFILFAVFLTAGVFAFADSPNSSLDDKPSVDSADSTGLQIPSVPSDAAASGSSSVSGNTAAVASAVAADTTSPSYLYDLKKLIEKSRENIKEVNEKIKEQAVLKRNQKREERAREYYEKGVELTNEGKLDEARDYFEKAIRITEHPEMAGYIKESQERLAKQESALHTQEREHYNQIKQGENVRKEDVEAAYKDAVALYKQKKYHPAKDAFEHVDEIAPDYRATDSYLKIIDQDIITADALSAKQQAVEIEHQQKEAEEARAKEKAMWLSQIEEKEKERKEAIDKQAEDVYDEAVVLYKHKKFAQAKKKFEEVSWVIPDYKETMRYLGRIDHDAALEQERVNQEQQKALQEQRWQEMVQQRIKDAKLQKELEAKERQHKKELQEQAQFLYTAAVHLYDQKNMDEALQKFNDIDQLLPDYRATRVYIVRIGQWKVEQQKEQLEAQRRAQEESLRQKEIAQERQRNQEIKEKYDRAQNHYDQALDLYRDHQWVQARSQFEAVEQIIPDYKSTVGYLQKIEIFIAKNPDVVVPAPETPAPEAAPANGSKPAPVEANVNVPPSQEPSVVAGTPPAMQASEEATPPAQEAEAVSMQAQQIQEQEIAAMAEVSAQLYNQIAEIADDRSTVQMKRKMAQVDEILNNLKENKEHILRQMREEQARILQEEANVKLETHRAEIKKMYQEAVDYYRSHDYSRAQVKFMALENIVPDYGSTRRYLKHIEVYLSQEGVQAKYAYEQNQGDQLKQLREKEKNVELLHNQKEQQEQRNLEEQQQMTLQSLAQKASDINDDIISLSKSQDYEAMKVKFKELENTVIAVMTLKDAMSKQKDHQKRERKLDIDSITRRYADQGPLKENRPAFPSSDLEQYKTREKTQEENMLFTEGVDCYDHKKYTQAKLLFEELAQQHDRRANAWLKKVDRGLSQEILNGQEAEAKERTAFLADQLQAQRELVKIQERERLRQKKLTEELERQKRLFEDDRVMQLRKEETMKAEERERETQEEKRLEVEKLSESQEETYRFHKIGSSSSSPSNAENEISNPGIVLPTMSPQSQAQIEAQRAAVRKQLEDGVESMYQEALSFYNQGNYAAAADRFKDVEDIIPGYKDTSQYLDVSTQKSSNVSPHEIVVPGSSSTPPTIARQDDVTKALDFFEPDAK